MAFCEINGFAVDIADGEWSESSEDIGAMGRAHSGAYRRTRWARKRTFEGATGVYDESDGEAIRSLLRGDGDSWDFDDSTYWERSARGTGIYSGSATRTTSSPAPKFGAACIEVSSGATLTFATDLGSDWTITHWKDASGGGVWNFFGLTSTGDYYVNGTKNTGADPDQWSGVTSGRAFLRGENNSNSASDAYYDEVIVLPYVATDAMISALAGRTAAVPGLPRVELGGDCVPAVVDVIGDEQIAPKLLQAYDDAASQWANNLRHIEFILHEV